MHFFSQADKIQISLIGILRSVDVSCEVINSQTTNHRVCCNFVKTLFCVFEEIKKSSWRRYCHTVETTHTHTYWLHCMQRMLKKIPCSFPLLNHFATFISVKWLSSPSFPHTAPRPCGTFHTNVCDNCGSEMLKMNFGLWLEEWRERLHMFSVVLHVEQKSLSLQVTSGSVTSVDAVTHCVLLHHRENIITASVGVETRRPDWYSTQSDFWNFTETQITSDWVHHWVLSSKIRINTQYKYTLLDNNSVFTFP